MSWVTSPTQILPRSTSSVHAKIDSIHLPVDGDTLGRGVTDVGVGVGATTGRSVDGG